MAGVEAGNGIKCQGGLFTIVTCQPNQANQKVCLLIIWMLFEYGHTATAGLVQITLRQCPKTPSDDILDGCLSLSIALICHSHCTCLSLFPKHRFIRWLH